MQKLFFFVIYANYLFKNTPLQTFKRKNKLNYAVYQNVRSNFLSNKWENRYQAES